MTIEKPKVQRVMVTARDPDGEVPSKTITLYGTTPERVIAAIAETARRSEDPDLNAAGMDDDGAPPPGSKDKSHESAGKTPHAA